MTLAWWPFIDLSLTLPWPCSHLALTLPWPCFDLALTLPWPSLDLALTLPCPCLDLALTLPWPCLDVASEGWHGPRSLLLKFGQNRISNYWDIPNMDKCHQDKCCLDKCRYGSWNRFNMVLGNCHLNLVEIRPVTAEILPTLSFRWWWVVVVVGGVPSHFCVKPKLWLGLGWVEVGLGFWQQLWTVVNSCEHLLWVVKSC